jgi:hypothetical protein
MKNLILWAILGVVGGCESECVTGEEKCALEVYHMVCSDGYWEMYKNCSYC